MLKNIAVFLLPLILCFSVQAQDNGGIERVTDFLVTGNWNGIQARGEYIFACNGYGLMVYRFNPDEGIDEPIEVTRYPTRGNAAGLVLRDTLCYIADGPGGLLILSIANLNNIYEVGVCRDTRGPHLVRLQGDIAYTGAGHGGLMTVSIEDPWHPEVLGGPIYGMVTDLEVYGDYIYVKLFQMRCVYIVSAEDLRNLEEVNRLETEYPPGDIEINDDRLFVSVGGRYVMVYSLDSPEDPQFITDIDIGEEGGYNTPRLKVIDDILFLFSGSPGIVNIQDIFRPIFYSRPRGVVYVVFAIEGDYAYACTADDMPSDSRWYIYDISNYRNPEFLWEFPHRGEFEAIAKQGDYLFISDVFHYDRDYSLRVVSIEDYDRPVEVANIDMNNKREEIQIVGDYAFLSNYWLDVYDISNPEDLQEVGGELCYAMYLNIDGDYAFIKGQLSHLGVDTLKVLSIADPRNIEVIASHIFRDSRIGGLGLADDLLLISLSLISDQHRFLVYDRSNPEDLELLGEYAFNAFVDGGKMVTYEDHVYSCSEKDPLYVFSIEDPTEPRLVHVNETLRGVGEPKLVDQYLFICTRSNGFSVFSLENPARPELVARYDTPGSVYGIFIEDGYAYVADENNIGIYDCARVIGIWDIQLSVESHNFGNVQLDSSALWQLTISNAAQQPVDILDISSDSVAFEVDFDDTITLDPGEDIILLVTFTPVENRDYSATLTIHTARRDVIVALRGRGEPLNVPEDKQLPLDFALHPAYPNPFNAMTTIRYDIARSTRLNISVYDLNGRLVENLTDGSAVSGFHRLTWNASRLSTGLYLVKMDTGERHYYTKVAIVR